jgi:hypothetical protein
MRFSLSLLDVAPSLEPQSCKRAHRAGPKATATSSDKAGTRARVGRTTDPFLAATTPSKGATVSTTLTRYEGGRRPPGQAAQKPPWP